MKLLHNGKDIWPQVEKAIEVAGLPSWNNDYANFEIKNCPGREFERVVTSMPEHFFKGHHSLTDYEIIALLQLWWGEKLSERGIAIAQVRGPKIRYTIAKCTCVLDEQDPLEYKWERLVEDIFDSIILAQCAAIAAEAANEN